MKMRLWILGSVVLLMLALAACGGGGAPAATKAPAAATKAPAAEAGDPEAGQQLYLNQGGCGACHTIEGIPGANGKVGPDHTHLATKAADLAKELGLSGPEEYIRQSIVEPNAHISEDCPTGPCTPGVMPANYKDQFTEKQINDLVVFLMQQK